MTLAQESQISQDAYHFVPGYLDQQRADNLLAWCMHGANLAWQQEQFTIYGRKCISPRWLWWCGDAGVNYRYTSTDHVAHGWPPMLGVLKDELSAYAQQPFNYLLLNRYDHGGHYMGWHRDDEAGAAPIIASLNLGETRRFRLRIGPGNPSQAVDLTHGSLLVFDGRYQHTLAKTKQVCGSRVNLTFRHVVGP